MWKRRLSCPEEGDDANSDDLSPLELSASSFKRSSLRRKDVRCDMERNFLKKVSSDSSFTSADLEMDNDGNSPEVQLIILQEQLVGAIIENQNLTEQLNKLRRGDGTAEKLLLLLAKERERNRALMEKLKDKDADENKRVREKSLPPNEKSPRSRSRGRFGWRRRGLEKSKSLDQSDFVASVTTDFSDDEGPETERDSKEWTRQDSHITNNSSINKEKERLSDISGPSCSDEKICLSLFSRMRKWLQLKLSDFLRDFTDVEEDEPLAPESEGDPLTVKRLKDNILRFSAIMKPLSELSFTFNSLFRWESPSTTFLVLIIYIGAVLYGYAVSLSLLFTICYLTYTYGRKRGWSLNLFSATRSRGTSESFESGAEVKIGDRFIVVLQVARKVQNILGSVSDSSEKIKNLFLWEHEVTQKLYITLWMLFVISLVFVPSHIFTVLEVYFGIKLFIIDYIFFRFPRIRRKFHSTSRLWDMLPTDADIERRNEKSGALQADLITFLELFRLPPSESPLPGWHGGKRCTLVNRDKSITSAFKGGKLYLTQNYLCFERSKTHPEKNIKVAFCDLVTLEKANSYPWIPGGGMAIEVFDASGKVYFFGGIINRDEVYDAILDSCKKCGITAKKNEEEQMNADEDKNDREKEKKGSEQEKKENEREKREREWQKTEKEREKNQKEIKQKSREPEKKANEGADREREEKQINEQEKTVREQEKAEPYEPQTESEHDKIGHNQEKLEENQDKHENELNKKDNDSLKVKDQYKKIKKQKNTQKRGQENKERNNEQEEVPKENQQRKIDKEQKKKEVGKNKGNSVFFYTPSEDAEVDDVGQTLHQSERAHSPF